MADKKKKTEYVAMRNFGALGKVYRVGEPVDVDDKTTNQLLGMGRIADASSGEGKVVAERAARAEKDRKAAEKKARLPGA